MRWVVLPLLRIAAWVYALLPGRLRLLLGWGLGQVLQLFRFRRNVIKQNLDYAYPNAERADLISAAYTNLGRLFLEVPMVLGALRFFVRRSTRLEGLEHWRAESAKGKGVIFLSSHIGNWEIMGATGAADGMDLMFVTKHLKPEWLHQAFEEGRLRAGVKATYEPRTLRDVLGHLKKGGTVGFVLDQYAGPPVSVRVPFFGIPVGTSTVVATLAKRTGAAVLPVVNFRTSDGRVVTRISPALDWVSDSVPSRELALNTARYAAVLESHIREFPEQWTWTHRRFKGDLSPLVEEEWEQSRARS